MQPWHKIALEQHDAQIQLKNTGWQRCCTGYCLNWMSLLIFSQICMANRDVWMNLCSLISAGINSISVSWNNSSRCWFCHLPHPHPSLRKNVVFWKVVLSPVTKMPSPWLSTVVHSFVKWESQLLTWQGLLGHSRIHASKAFQVPYQTVMSGIIIHINCFESDL